jgi:hypothetical protein
LKEPLIGRQNEKAASLLVDCVFPKTQLPKEAAR